MNPQKQFIFTNWAHPALYAAESPINGTGLFTSQDIEEGATVVIWGGVLVPYELLDETKHRPKATTGFDATYFLTLPIGAPQPVEDFMNHSCDPNTWMADERTVVARRFIKAGSEVTTDFALWWAQDYQYTNECCCGTDLCRRVITGLDWQRPELQQRYKNRFLPFMNEKIAQLTKT